MDMKKIILLVLCVFSLTGCITGKFEYTPPDQLRKTENSKIIDNTKDAVWKSAISKLGASFFVINNIDKDSGFINLSFSGNPEKYLDCGKIKSVVSNARGERVYEFSASNDNKRYETYSDGNLYFINRKISLDGRANIIIQEASNEKTLVTVNARYVASRVFEVSDVTNKILENSSESTSFNTNSAGEFKDSSGSGTVCLSSGMLEREILNLVQE